MWSESGEKGEKMGRPITAEEMHQRIIVMKEQTFRNGFQKTEEIDEFFQEYWMEILDMLDVEQLHNTQKELDYWYKLAKSYERTILKLCTALTEEKDGAERK